MRQGEALCTREVSGFYFCKRLFAFCFFVLFPEDHLCRATKRRCFRNTKEVSNICSIILLFILTTETVLFKQRQELYWL